MVVSLTVGAVFAFAGVEKKVSSNQLERHTRKRPQIRTCVVIDAKHDLGAPVLPRLDFVREVVMRPAPISQVADLKSDVLGCEGASFVHVLFLGHLLLLFNLELVKIVLFASKVVLHFSLEVAIKHELPLAGVIFFLKSFVSWQAHLLLA